MRIKPYLGMLAVPVIILVAALGISQLVTEPVSPLVGHTAATVEGPIIAGPGAEDGDRFRLTDLRGTVVVLDFWASWCEPCERSAPILNRVSDAVPNAAFYGISVDSLPPSRVRAEHARFEYSFPSLLDQGNAMAHTFGVESLPTLVVIDPEGQVAHVERGVPNEEDLTELLRSLAAGG